jgi:adenine phosphoribosyltransferase
MPPSRTVTELSRLIRDVPDFPKPGILFKDVTPLLADGPALRATIDHLAERAAARRPDLIVGIEARGFIFGAAVAAALGVGFAPVRKPGKLPYRTRRVSYALEYGEGALDLHLDAVAQGARALIVDDLLATGGTAAAAAELVRQGGGEVVGCAFVIELAFLAGRARLAPLAVDALIEY